MENKPRKPRFENPFYCQEDDDLSCGFCFWKPKWLQRCNNMKIFILCYVLVGVFQGLNFSYYSAILPSIEKRFGFKTESMGVTKSMNDISHLLAALFVAHYGGSGSAHRPRWIAAGSFIVGVGLLLMAAPEVLFPVTKTSNLFAMMAAKAGGNENIRPLIIFGLAEFLIGLGGTTSIILGLPFVDDQVSHLNTPIYFVFCLLGRGIGPVIGLGLGSVFNQIFFDFSHPEFSATDPRWISAWYLGFIIAGLGVCICSLTLGCFPSSVPESTKKNDSETKDDGKELKKNLHPERKKPVLKRIALKDLPGNLKRLATNYTFVLKVFSQLISSFVLSGYMNYSKKFMKEQYQVPQAFVALAGGMPPIFSGFIGLILGGVLIKYLKFRPVQVVYMMIASSVVGAVCYFSAITLGCDMQHIVGVDDVPDPYNLSSSNLCFTSKNCNCGNNEFNPVCDSVKRVSYINPCVAGCRSHKKKDDNKKFYFDCSCVGTIIQNTSSNYQNHSSVSSPPSKRYSKDSPRIISGQCSKTCPNFVLYIVVMSIAALFMGMPVAGILMVQFRIVDVDLKSLANAVTVIVMSACGFLPAPIIMGHLIDSSCRYWSTNQCGVKGACMLYNMDDFRWKIHGAVGIVRLVQCVIDSIIAYRVRNLSFDREKEKESGELPPVESAITLVIADEPEQIELQDVVRRLSTFTSKTEKSE